MNYFTYETDKMLACPCCGDKGMVTDFLNDLNCLRHIYGKPLIVTSGFRCSAYNSKISSTGPNGPHTTGRAIDLQVTNPDALPLVKLAIDLGFKGIGINQKGEHSKRFIHIDKSRPHQTIWSY
jgi:uncharacterized protein YcbK (DUF882 family)